MLQARRRGLIVAKPWGDSARYDFLVDNGRRIFRVQVKSAGTLDGGTYRIGSGSGRRSKRPYTRSQIDVLAAYVIPCKTWYLIPVDAFSPVKTIRLCPHRESGRRFERYREGWEMFDGDL